MCLALRLLSLCLIFFKFIVSCSLDVERYRHRLSHFALSCFIHAVLCLLVSSCFLACRRSNRLLIALSQHFQVRLLPQSGTTLICAPSSDTADDLPPEQQALPWGKVLSNVT